MKKSMEQLYQEFRNQGYDHITARDLAFTVARAEFKKELNNLAPRGDNER